MKVEILSELNTIPYRGNKKTPWLVKDCPREILLEDFSLMVCGERYSVPKNYIFDGASIPTILWFLYSYDYKYSWRASAFHDYCYSHLYKKGVTKSFADKVFREIMVLDGARKTTAWLFYWAVRLFGKGGWNK